MFNVLFNVLTVLKQYMEASENGYFCFRTVTYSVVPLRRGWLIWNNVRVQIGRRLTGFVDEISATTRVSSLPIGAGANRYLWLMQSHLSRGWMLVTFPTKDKSQMPVGVFGPVWKESCLNKDFILRNVLNHLWKRNSILNLAENISLWHFFNSVLHHQKKGNLLLIYRRCFQSSVFTEKSVLTGRSPRRGIVGPRSVNHPSAVSLFHGSQSAGGEAAEESQWRWDELSDLVMLFSR